MTYPTPDYRLSPPEDRCRICPRPALAGADCCSAICADKARTKDATYDAKALAEEAWARDEDDPVTGLAWLWFTYRSRPTEYEALVRDMAIALMRKDCTPEEWAVWCELKNNPWVSHLAGAVAAKHLNRREGVRVAA